MTPIQFYRHDLGEKELASVKRALDGVFLTAGPLTKRFEEEFADYLHCQRVVGTYSCTTALFLCLKALDIGPGDEVITTPMTFIASANAVLEAGATPVFVDVEEATGNIDISCIERAITPRTRAIIPVHLYGQMCDMKAIRRIADAHQLFVIEDSAHCVEGERDGIRPAQVSDAACFSFYATKNLTSGEGGAIATNSPVLADRLLLLRSHGMNKEAAGRYTESYRHWDMVCMGYKGNMFDIQAALLLPQLPHMDNNLNRREEISAGYREAFSPMKEIDLPTTLPGVRHAHHLFTIWVDQRDAFLERLQAQGVGVAVNYRPVHLLTYYRQRFNLREGMFPIAERIGQRTLSLPLYPGLTDEAVIHVIRAVQQATADIGSSMPVLP
jgi:UDP-4-amino-4-deoxy-L-arabinose-oxoglutarate aminotransferase